MGQLAEKKCQVCEGNILPMTMAKAKAMLQEVDGWELSSDSKYIMRKFEFKGFYATMSFVNAVAYVAQKEGHHPDMGVGYKYCVVKFTTHAIDGLTENDFICAAKINKLID